MIFFRFRGNPGAGCGVLSGVNEHARQDAARGDVAKPGPELESEPEPGPELESEPESEPMPEPERGSALTRPTRRPVGRRKLLMGVVGLGALAAAAGLEAWVRQGDSHGPRLWRTTAANGRLALSTGRQQGLYVSGFDGSVRALDPRTGEVRWSRAVSTPDAAGPQGGWPVAAGDGVVCVATDTRLCVLDAASGEQRWEAALPDRSEGGWRQGPAVGGGSVFAVHGSSVRCYDLATGEPRWTGPAGASAALALAGGTVYAAGRSTGVLALDARSGERLWERDVVATGPLTVHRGILLLVSVNEAMVSTFVSALDGTTGEVRWRSVQHGVVDCPLSAADGTAVVFGGIRLTGLDVGTGDRRWSTDVPAGSHPGPVAMVAADGGGVYADAGDEQLYAFDPATSGLRWQDQSEPLDGGSGGGNPISLAAAGGTVYRAGRADVLALGSLPPLASS
ncbi:hypothetical protein GCM10010519_39600 [Streptomyces lactacystinicus]